MLSFTFSLSPWFALFCVTIEAHTITFYLAVVSCGVESSGASLIPLLVLPRLWSLHQPILFFAPTKSISVAVMTLNEMNVGPFGVAPCRPVVGRRRVHLHLQVHKQITNK